VVTNGPVHTHAFGLVGARDRIAVFVVLFLLLLLLLLALIQGVNLSGTLITDISDVLTALIGSVLCCSRDRYL
jgi:hypothetical protein